MRTIKDAELFNALREYFKVYLPKQKQVSPNTIRSYQNALESLLDYIVKTIRKNNSHMKHLHNYIRLFHSDSADSDYLFFTNRKMIKKQMTTDNARRIVRYYGIIAREKCNAVPENVHPHLFRHSRAMHLYQNGMPLALISQWLGHSSVETTLIYAYADTEMKRKAIESARKSMKTTIKTSTLFLMKGVMTA